MMIIWKEIFEFLFSEEIGEYLFLNISFFSGALSNFWIVFGYFPRLIDLLNFKHSQTLSEISFDFHFTSEERVKKQIFSRFQTSLTRLRLACGSNVEIFFRLINNSCCCCLLIRNEKWVISRVFQARETSSSARSQSNLVEWLRTDSINHLSLWTINAG